MIEYSHVGNVTYACFAGETDSLRYNWFKSLHNGFKRKLPFMGNAVISSFILKYTPVGKTTIVGLNVILMTGIVRKLAKKLLETGS